MSNLDAIIERYGNITSLINFGYIFCTNTTQSADYPIFNSNSPHPRCVCDWRVNIYGCDNTPLFITLCTLSAFLSFIAAIILFTLLIYKTCRKGQPLWAPPRRVPSPIIPSRRSRFGIEGVLRPKPVENYLLFSGIHMLTRGVTSVLATVKSMQNLQYYVFLVETAQCIPWYFAWLGVVLYVIGVYYHIPGHKPYKQMTIDCVGLAVLCLPICGSLVMILTSCRRRLNLDVAGADTILTIHGLMWGIVDWFVIFGLMVVVYRLWRVFRAYVGEVELVGSKSDAMRVRRLKRGFLKMKIVILFLLAPLVFLAVTTPIYAFRRKIMIMGSTSSVIWIGFWVLAMPVIMCLVAAVLAYGTFRQDPDNQSNVITPTQSLHLQDTWSPASPKRPEAENEAIKSLNPNPAVEINQLQLSSYFNLLPSPRPANPHESSAARSARVANEMTSRTGMVSWHDFELGILETSPKPPPPPVRVSHALPAFEMHPNLDKPIWRPQPTQSYSGPSVSASTKEKESESIRTHMRRGSERSMESFGTFGATSSANNEL